MNQFHLIPALLSGHLHCRFFFFIAFLTVVILLTAEATSAQATVDSVRTPSLTKPESIKIPDTVSPVTAAPKRSTSPQKSAPSIKIAAPVDSSVEKSYAQAMVAYYHALERKNIADANAFDSLASYNNWALKNRIKVIEKQQVFAKFIFVLVIIVVLSGLVFSALQFRNALKHSNKKNTVSDTTVKASLAGIEVSSSILGVIILTLSIVFFYLYLTRVYPVVLVN